MFSNRVEFTKALGWLLVRMANEDEQPLLDWVKRSPEEQQRMVEKGLSKTLNSYHLKGMAADIYFTDGKGNLTEPKAGWDYWHRVWEKLGGREEINWDRVHFE